MRSQFYLVRAAKEMVGHILAKINPPTIRRTINGFPIKPLGGGDVSNGA